MRRATRVVGVCALLVGGAGCDTQKKVNAVLDKADKGLDEIPKMAQAFMAALDEFKKSTQAATQQSTAAMAKVAALPSSATGGVDLNTVAVGKVATVSENIDGKNEMVTVFQKDDDGAVFESWTGSAQASSTAHGPRYRAELDDAGVCYLEWRDEAVASTWVVVSDCGDQVQAYVCEVKDGGGEHCRACNMSGACNDCAPGADCVFP